MKLDIYGNGFSTISCNWVQLYVSAQHKESVCQTNRMDRIRVMRIIARMNVGGPAVEITELMRGLDPEKFDQQLLTGWCADGEADFLETQAPEIQVTRIPRLGRSIKPWDDLVVLVALTREIRKFKPHIVHTHTAKAGVLGRIAARISLVNPQVVHTYHGHLLHGYFGKAKTHLVVSLERLLAKITDRFVSVGQGVRDDLVAAKIGSKEKFTVIYSGISLGELPKKSTARSTLNLPQDVPVILMLGRITGIKRPDRFAEMVEIIARSNSKAVFIVAGAGDKEPELAATIKALSLPVLMLGWRSDIENLLAASDIMVLTSDNEGTPLSLVQAGLANLAIVATNVGSVSEVIQDNVTGLLVPPDAQALAASVLSLIKNPQKRNELGIRAHDFMTTRFCPELFLSNHASLYEHCSSLKTKSVTA